MNINCRSFSVSAPLMDIRMMGSPRCFHDIGDLRVERLHAYGQDRGAFLGDMPDDTDRNASSISW